MRFPSLLYTDVHSDTPIEKHVFEDLQLTQIVSGDVFDVAGYLCCRDDIFARQKVFSLIENPGCLEWFSQLFDCVSEIAHLYECIDEACCDEERNAIFPAAFREYLHFAGLASEPPHTGNGEYPEFISHFSQFFSEICRKAEAAGYSAEVEKAEEKVRKISECSICIDGKYIRFNSGATDGLSAKLKKCAERLGVKSDPVYSGISRQQDKSFFESCLKLYPDDFSALGKFYNLNCGFCDSAVIGYKDELKFYTELRRMFDTVLERGIPLRYPELSKNGETHISQAYDISLLAKQDNIVPNDIDFTSDERFFFLTGANGGGKTTYLRTVGIAAVMFMLGCPVPCLEAEIPVFDRIFTHFPHDERFSGSGRFVEEQRRAEEILESAGPESLVLLNETYSSTNEENALEMTSELAERLYKSGASGLYITHQHGLAPGDIPYLNVLVDSGDGNRRTFKIVRKRSDNTSLAYDILKKYRLTEEDLKIRFADNGD